MKALLLGVIFLLELALLGSAGHAAPGAALVALWAADKAALTLADTPI
ncbi:hypothetical protein [Micromonospora marina]